MVLHRDLCSRLTDSDNPSDSNRCSRRHIMRSSLEREGFSAFGIEIELSPEVVAYNPAEE